jgi:hypothetical protein
MTDATSLANNLERPISPIIDARVVSERTSQCAFFGVSAVLFAASAAVAEANGPKAGRAVLDAIDSRGASGY